MSGSKKSRGGSSRTASTRAQRSSSVRARELHAARRRARTTKAVVAAGGATIFGVAMLFARESYAGHAKQQTTPLAAPPEFVTIVQQNLLRAGVVAPAQAPPDAATTVS